MIADVAFWTPGASTTAHRVDMLFLFNIAVCVSVGLLVAFLLIYVGIRYRRRPGETGNPRSVNESRLLEWFWTLSPLAIFVVMFAWGASVYVEVCTPPPDATPIYVAAKQWMWKFQHPEGQREIDTLHVPVGRPVKLLLVSEDVIHSFFVPAFRIHMDVLPMRYTSVWFQATQPGTFHLFCSQYCGTNHAGMIGSVIAMAPAEYQEWLRSTAEGSLALRGRQTFLKYRCLSCHSADAEARAPVLENLFNSRVALADGNTVIADHSYVRNSILRPSAQIVVGYQDIMPPFAGEIEEEEIAALVAYIETLKAGDTPPRVESFPPPPKSQGLGAGGLGPGIGGEDDRSTRAPANRNLQSPVATPPTPSPQPQSPAPSPPQP